MASTLELKFPPLPLALVVAVIMWVLAQAGRGGWEVLPGQRTIAIVVSLLGAVIVVLGIVAFRRFRTTVNPMKPEAVSTLVTCGIYRLTRNPMYVGFLLVLSGWALFLSNALAVSGVPAYFLYMNRFQIEPEERVLAATFGLAYSAYKSRVRRWL
ncbi:MAG: isoprenylcysteine carboxylmethyltransferase family protein [Gammaproteobacteria bacterium]